MWLGSDLSTSNSRSSSKSLFLYLSHHFESWTNVPLWMLSFTWHFDNTCLLVPVGTAIFSCAFRMTWAPAGGYARVRGCLGLLVGAVVFEIEGVSGHFTCCVHGGTEWFGEVAVKISKSTVSIASNECERAGNGGLSFTLEVGSVITDSKVDSYSNNRTYQGL